MSELPALDRVYTVQELAEHLEVSPYTVAALIDSSRSKSLPNFSASTNKRIRQVTHSALLEFLSHEAEPKIRRKDLPLPPPSQRRLRLAK
ncbi:hypothetical protein SH449x_004072 [Pirellulaceae bacterium SH449]